MFVPLESERERTDDMTPEPLGGGFVRDHIADCVVDLCGERSVADRAGPDLFVDHVNLLMLVWSLTFFCNYTPKYSKSQATFFVLLVKS